MKEWLEVSKVVGKYDEDAILKATNEAKQELRDQMLYQGFTPNEQLWRTVVMNRSISGFIVYVSTYSVEDKETVHE